MIWGMLHFIAMFFLTMVMGTLLDWAHGETSQTISAEMASIFALVHLYCTNEGKKK